MSPDPPREESGDDDDDHIRSFNGELFEGVMDDQEFFIVPDAPYELDMEDESEYSDSEDDGHPASSNSAVPNSNSVQVTHEQEFLFEGQRQGRGRYRLLIPFPAANAATTATPTPANSINDTTPSNNASSMDMTTVTGGESEPTADTERERPGSDECTAAQTTQSSTPSKTDEILSETPSTSTSSHPDIQPQQREIEMTEEKVETIKEVMKKITLPDTAIPKWAAEVDEEAWRRKLHDSISKTKSGNST